VNESRACVVLPTYNERENVPQIVPAILAASAALDVLVVDDNSPDGTGALADKGDPPGFKVVEVPITFVDRRVGQSKMSRRIVAEALWMVWKIRVDRAANAG